MYTCGNSPNNSSKQQLNCSTAVGSVEYYSVGCGLNDGQIIGAHIVYDGAESKALNLIKDTIDLLTEELEITGTVSGGSVIQ